MPLSFQKKNNKKVSKGLLERGWALYSRHLIKQIQQLEVDAMSLFS